jgi:hypothetical protein
MVALVPDMFGSFCLVTKFGPTYVLPVLFGETSQIANDSTSTEVRFKKLMKIWDPWNF